MKEYSTLISRRVTRYSVVALYALGVCISSVYAGAQGTTGMNFLKISNSVRGVAMGEAHVAVADDVGAIAWNPAGLTQLNTSEATFTYNKWLEGISAQYLAYAVPLRVERKNARTKNYGTLGASITYLAIEPFASYDDKSNSLGTVDASDLALSVSYALQMYRRVSVGMNLKYLSETLAGIQATSYAMDIGVLVKTLAGVGVGAAVQNVGTPIVFIKDKGELPRNYKLGISYERDILQQPLTLAFDVNIPNDNDTFYCMGTEYWIKDVLALRGGYRTGVDVGSGIRCGLGFKTNLCEIDYAFTSLGELGDTHRVSMTARFGSGIQMSRKTILYERGMRCYEEGKFIDAIHEFNHLLQLEPQNKDAVEMLRKSYDALNTHLQHMDRSQPIDISNNDNFPETRKEGMHSDRRDVRYMTRAW